MGEFSVCFRSFSAVEISFLLIFQERNQLSNIRICQFPDICSTKLLDISKKKFGRFCRRRQVFDFFKFVLIPFCKCIFESKTKKKLIVWMMVDILYILIFSHWDQERRGIFPKNAIFGMCDAWLHP